MRAVRHYDPAYRQPYLSADTPTPFDVIAPDAARQLNRHILREQGITLFGPPPAPLIAPLTRDELVAAVRTALAGWRTYPGARPVTRTRYYQAFAILTMCRALYALEHGVLVSKLVAARWPGAQTTPWTRPPLLSPCASLTSPSSRYRCAWSR